MSKEGQPGDWKEKAKKWGLVAGIAGGTIFLVTASGLALTAAVGGGATYFGAKKLEERRRH